MTPHVPTLLMVMVFVSAILAALLICTWLQDRSVRSLPWWSATCLLAALGMRLLGLRGAIPDILCISAANAILILAAGTMWSGARVFAGQAPRWGWLGLPPLTWFVVSQLPPMSGDYRLRIVVLSLAVAAYVFATAYTFWQGRAEPLMSRWTVIGVLAVHGAIHLMRIPTTYLLPIPPESQLSQSSYFGFLSMGLLLFMVTFTFTLLALTKERAELHFRRAAYIDPLTGLLNRRALFEACPSLEGSANLGAASVLIFDLDRFKQINDRFGHPVGDHVLQLFAVTARAELRGCDLLGRMGGEEFAAVLPGCSAEQALAVAERVRRRFAEAASRVGFPEFSPTVSVGVSASSDGPDLLAAFADADRAVYRAKEEGRNCVRLARRGRVSAPPSPARTASMPSAAA